MNIWSGEQNSIFWKHSKSKKLFSRLNFNERKLGCFKCPKNNVRTHLRDEFLFGATFFCRHQINDRQNVDVNYRQKNVDITCLFAHPKLS
jgi:hypothetical protein